MEMRKWMIIEMNHWYLDHGVRGSGFRRRPRDGQEKEERERQSSEDSPGGGNCKFFHNSRRGASAMAHNAFSRLVNLHRHFNITKSGTKGGNENAAPGTIKISHDVSTALSNGKAVVALESTIISHGMPYPQNLETAKELEAILKENGAVPATIAILDGIPCIGLSAEELEMLAKLGPKARKISRRDIAYVVTLDISSDLTELGKTPIAVVSAGVKSILDIPKTLEYMETQGVCVVSYKTDDFPAFFTEKSGCKSMPLRAVKARLVPLDQRPLEVNRKLDLKSGILIAVPIPKEHSVSGNVIESAIQTALREAGDKGITGSAETPYLLSRVNDLTGGASLESNIALVKNNAVLAAQIAVSLAKIEDHGHRKGAGAADS
ncbi:Indigoidine synthase A-like protein [Cynara cardunculus var. scolymus]|uniref:Indigoidine synthase A-like protein n=1 Tax=Cynara cardunculus var. scolymus TaxID=59895 RepID=A0A103YFA0_CYNCS|nr:Indigoidine synthase A-like protein [Cynara cardunculus var. scolymus]